MRNPNLDYKSGMTDLYSVYILEEDQRTYIGEGNRSLVDFISEKLSDLIKIEPSRSVIGFSGQDVVGIGEHIE